MKIEIFNREICVCALLATNSISHFMDLAIHGFAQQSSAEME